MSLVIALVLLPLAVLTAFFTMEVIAGLSRRPAEGWRTPGASATIIVPAHDEESVIAETLARLKSAAGTRARILVVADNCSDETATIARDVGVDVIERRAPEQRGKGFALAFAAERLRESPPDVVVVLDADCAIDAPSLDALIATAAGSNRPCQAVNLLRPDRTQSPLVQLSTFAFMLKNLVRQRGLQRLTGRAHLTGTGMAMPFELFAQSRLATANVVEDLALGLELAGRGHPPQLVPQANVWSSGSTEGGTLVQRRRWEGGFLQTSMRFGPRALWRSISRGDVRGALAALDLLVPPTALLALLDAVAVAVCALLAFLFGVAWWPMLTLFAISAAAATSVLAAWLREGRSFVSLATLLRLPLYAIWKLPLYLRLGRGGVPREWLRTGR